MSRQTGHFANEQKAHTARTNIANGRITVHLCKPYNHHISIVCCASERERASEKVESKPYAVKWRSDHCQSPPPQTGAGNWNASNAMQIMSFRFSIKMLNYYFALRYQSQPVVDSCAANKQSVGQTLVNRQPDQHTYAPVITALIYCLWFCDINLFIIFTGQSRRCLAVAPDQWKK